MPSIRLFVSLRALEMRLKITPSMVASITADAPITELKIAVSIQNSLKRGCSGGSIALPYPSPAAATAPG